VSIANWLTFLRILLIPVFITALMYRRLDLALGSFVLAAITDVLDGYVARRTKVTTLGRFLDPTADKLLLVSAFIVLPIVYQFPVWISAVVVSRDVIIALGYLTIYLHWGSARIRVRPLGKLTTFLQSFCVAALMLSKLLSAF
jgi:cardiolipin synthase (CMP-forming)